MEVIAFRFGLFLVALVLFATMLSYFDEEFFPEQMQHRWRQKRVIPFCYHGGMLWGDLLVLPPLCWWIIKRFGYEWTDQELVRSLVAGAVITLANQVNLGKNQNVPDPCGWQGQWISSTIFVHFVYMTLVTAVFWLFVFYTDGVSRTAAAWVAIIIGFHLTAGTHGVLGIINRFVRFDWCPDFMGLKAILFQLGIWSLACIIAWIASGTARAMVPVFVVGLISLFVVCAVSSQTEEIR